MNCLTELEIQMYMDGELWDDELCKAEKHMNSCQLCAETYRKLTINKAHIFELLDELKQHEGSIEIPVFTPTPPKYRFARAFTTVSVAASMLLIIGLAFYLKKKHTQQEQALNIAKATIELTRNADPNQMLHDKQMIIVITNSSGEVVHTYISE